MMTGGLRSRTRQYVIAASTALSIFAAFLVPLPLAGPAPQARSFQVTARSFAFDPAVLAVQQGDTVTVHLESLDAAHGFYIDGYSVDLHAEPGKSAQVTFKADHAGKFAIRCSVSCGVLHPFMIGEINVDPDLPWARAAAATLLTALGTTLFFWRKAPSS